MPKRRRLSRSGEFDRVYRDGSSHATRYLVLYSFPRKDEEARDVRLGVSVSRKVGGERDIEVAGADRLHHRPRALSRRSAATRSTPPHHERDHHHEGHNSSSHRQPPGTASYALVSRHRR